MSFKFNSGKGGIICDKCHVLIDEGINLQMYLELKDATNTLNAMNGIEPTDKDYCWKCRKNHKEDI